MNRWWILGLLATIFTVLGAICMIVLGREDPAGFWGGAAFVVIGLGLFWPTLEMRREEHMDEVAAPDAVPGGVPWPEVARRLEARFADTPYDVETEGSIIRIRADLADATFLTWAAAHRVNAVRGVEVVAKKPGQAITRDYSQSFDLRGGVGVLPGAPASSRVARGATRDASSSASGRTARSASRSTSTSAPRRSNARSTRCSRRPAGTPPGSGHCPPRPRVPSSWPRSAGSEGSAPSSPCWCRSSSDAARGAQALPST